MSGKPTTVDLALDEPLRARVRDAVRANDHTVRLTVRGVVPPAPGATAGMNVFLNKPDATATTPTTDPHYVGAVEFQPTGGVTAPQSFAFDLNDVLKGFGNKLTADKPLRITFVAVPSEGSGPTAEVRIPFREVVLEVAKPKAK